MPPALMMSFNSFRVGVAFFQMFEVTATADPVLDAEPAPVTVLGIDETRRGKAKYETCPETGKRVWRTGSTPGWSMSPARQACWCGQRPIGETRLGVA
jgi:hypothetical protein